MITLRLNILLIQEVYLCGSGCGIDRETGGSGEDVDASDVPHSSGVLGGQGLHHAPDVLSELRVPGVGVAHCDHGAGAGVREGQLGGVQAPGHLLGEILGLKIDLERKLLPGVERFAKELGQQSDNPIIGKEKVELVAELDLGLELFVLNLELPE